MLIETPCRSVLAAGRAPAEAEAFPAEVEMILSSMEAGRIPESNLCRPEAQM